MGRGRCWLYGGLIVVLALLGAAWPTSADDTSPPNVVILSPRQGEAVSGNRFPLLISYTGSQERRIRRVELLVDGQAVGHRDLAPPEIQGNLIIFWDTTRFPDGEHTVQVKVYDEAGGEGSYRIRLYVGNRPGSRQPPRFQITYPRDQQTVSGRVEIRVLIEDESTIQWVIFYIDDNLKALRNYPPYVDVWDTTRVENGPHKIRVKAINAWDMASEQEITVIVDNPGGRTQRRTSPAAPLAVPQEAGPAASPAAVAAPVVTPPLLPRLTPSGGPSPAEAVPTAAPALEGGAPVAVAPSVGQRPELPIARVSLPAPPALGEGAEKVTAPPRSASPLEATPLLPVAEAQTGRAMTMGAPQMALQPRWAPPMETRPVITGAAGGEGAPRPAADLASLQPTMAPLLPRISLPQPGERVQAKVPVEATPSALGVASPHLPSSSAPVSVAPQSLPAPAAAPRPALTTPPAEMRPVATVPRIPTSAPRTQGWASSISAGGPEALAGPRLSLPETRRPLPRPKGPAAVSTFLPGVGSRSTTGRLSEGQGLEGEPSAALAPRISLPLGRRPTEPVPPRPAPSPLLPPQPVSLPGHPKGLIHVVQPGETLSQIAARYRVSLQELVRINNLRNPRLILAGQRLTIPGPALRLFFDRRPVRTDVSPFIQQGIPLAPFRHIFEETGGVVQWEHLTKRVHARNAERTIELRIGDRRALVNEQELLMELAPFILHSRTIVPLSFISEAMDVTVQVDTESGNIYITSNR